MTFTLPGFNTVKREGVQLPANFTATINVDLNVGALEETITVSGESPTVDLRSAGVARSVTPEVIRAVPNGAGRWRHRGLTRRKGVEYWRSWGPAAWLGPWIPMAGAPRVWQIVRGSGKRR